MEVIFIFNENQNVTVKWHNSNITRLKSLGYIFTHIGDEVKIKAKDLAPSSSIKVDVVCDYCGKNYKTSYCIVSKAMNNNELNACHDCAATKAIEKSKPKRSRAVYNKLQAACVSKGYKLITVDNGLLDCLSEIEYECPVHGIQKTTADNFIHGHGCYYCGRINTGKKLRKDIQEIIDNIESVNGNMLLNPEDYKDGKVTNLRIRCSCGNVFTTSYDNYTKHDVTRCRTCSSKNSSGELLVASILDELKEPYIREYRIDNCRDKKPLPFDFYLPNKGKMIEFDGQIHYQEIDGRSHQKTVEHDKIKNDYCYKNSIPILRIPYWERDNAKQMINDFLNR